MVGRILRPHGVHGEVSVEVRTDDPEHRFGPGAVLATEPAERGPLVVERARPHRDRMLVHFAGVADRDGALALRGVMLLAESTTSAASADSDQFWDHELVGLAAEQVDGTPIGTVREVVHLPGGDQLLIEADGGRLLQVPFATAIVPVVDVSAGRLVVDPPEGLFEL